MMSKWPALSFFLVMYRRGISSALTLGDLGAQAPPCLPLPARHPLRPLSACIVHREKVPGYTRGIPSHQSWVSSAASKRFQVTRE